MSNRSKNREELLNELADLRRTVVQLQQKETEYKATQERLYRLHRAYSAYVDLPNRFPLGYRDPQKLYEDACQIALLFGELVMAWVGLVDADTGILNPVAQFPGERGYRWDVLVARQGGEPTLREGLVPGEEAVTGLGQIGFGGGNDICNDIENDPRMLPWREEALKRGYRSWGAFSLHVGTRVIGALSVYSRQLQYFHDALDGEEFRLLESLAMDVSNGLQFIEEEKKRKQAEARLQGTLSRLRKAMGATIQALASTVEYRDPYTAGHQRRVADLARAIATELSLPQHNIEGLRMAGVIHDLGKISVPAEILSKPGKLTEPEFGLVKPHSQAGYEILKPVKFPWPVAQMVREHHERVNGSGYPQGLSGDDILLEARILGVADVVEAMGSHRPYRAALGIERALAEISEKRGALYHPDVVDACLNLFNNKQFQLE